MGYPSIPFTVTLTDDFNLFFENQTPVLIR